MTATRTLISMACMLAACGDDVDLGTSTDTSPTTTAETTTDVTTEVAEEVGEEVTPVPPCEDKVLGVGETDLDCGGVCPPCATNQLCEDDGDCLSGACDFGVCRDPSCTDGRPNGDETGLDCGGPCGGCGVGLGCEEANDCASGLVCENDSCCTANACGGCGAPPAEVCNALDDNCDGSTDEGCNEPRIIVAPAAVDFATVSSDAGTRSMTITIANEGGEDLLITGFALSGHPNFGVVFPGLAPFAVSAETVAGIDFERAFAVEPHSHMSITVTFFATGAEPVEGALVLRSNDADAVGGTTVPLQANAGGPCIRVNPVSLDFGGALVGGGTVTRTVEIESCGDEPLTIGSVALAPGGSSEFTLTQPASTTLAPDASTSFEVRYTPNDVSAVDGESAVIRDTARVIITSDAFEPETEVEVSGFGTNVACPTAVIIIQGASDGGEVAPGTQLRLDGTQSYAAAGGVVEYRWSVTSPTGSTSVFQPSPSNGTPRFEAAVVGVYQIELTVVGENGEESCEPARVTLYVVPTAALHIELLWHTPEDPDESNEGAAAGSDLDLHFLHPFASTSDEDGDGRPDGWFDDHHDCNWQNESPNWGSVSPLAGDDPELARDDTDGGGPEILSFDSPESDRCYRVGVHYWDDHGFGASFATVRVYVYANRVFEMADVALEQLDMWSVTEVCWPPTGETPAPTKVCEGSFDACESAVDCDPGDACELRIAHDYCQPLIQCTD